MPGYVGHLRSGRPDPLGSHFDGAGTNFAVFSAGATRVELCLYDDHGHESARLALPDRTDDIWHGYAHGIAPGQRYGIRVHGPYAPEQGQRFNPNKLLVDPFARLIDGPIQPDFRTYGYQIEKAGNYHPSATDSAPFMPKAIVVEPPANRPGILAPSHALEDTILYEVHVRGATMMNRDVPKADRGRFAGLASDVMLEHLVKLGITTVELLPVHAHFDERFLTDGERVNYWGYNPFLFFALDCRLAGEDPIAEFLDMVDRFHGAGLEVVLDVVFNHSGEGNQFGPTLSFRGLDNESYYRLQPDNRALYIDDTGTGNGLNVDHPQVRHLILSSLRYWAGPMGVDGFRFDLATSLGRRKDGFDPGHPLLKSIAQDPILSGKKLIAEPWDVGPGGYQLGSFPPPFLEWNDRFRDTARRYWVAEPGLAPELATSIAGSADIFDHNARSALSSLNFVTAHDGFTLADLVSYAAKHNDANGEGNRDGHDRNYSVNHGVEGPCDDPAIVADRARHRRNLLATMMLSQGVPMMLGGDEVGNSQFGNNNAYCQDNETGWIDWSACDPDFLVFCRRLIALRRSTGILGQAVFLHGAPRPADGLPDLEWLGPDGSRLHSQSWQERDARAFAVAFRKAAGGGQESAPGGAVFLAVNGSPEPCRFHLADLGAASVWSLQLDTGMPDGAPARDTRLPGRSPIDVAAHSLLVFIKAADAD